MRSVDAMLFAPPKLTARLKESRFKQSSAGSNRLATVRFAGASACSACSAAACTAGQYLSGCGGASAGTCAECVSGSYSSAAGEQTIQLD